MTGKNNSRIHREVVPHGRIFPPGPPGIWTWAITALAVAAFLPAPGRCQDSGRDAVRSAVVQIFAQANPMDPFSPWQGTGIEARTGSGVVIEGNRILTVAHVASDAVTIEVKRQDQTRKFSASVSELAHPCDLAILKVDDPSFFEGSTPLLLGPTPTIEDEVKVYGFPEGGDSVSATSGIVSRVEVSTYSFSWRELLLVQVDAAINPGNSGGPVVANGKLVGIAMQMLSGAENIGYMIPSAVVRHFLADLQDGRFDGFPSLGAEVQPLENPALRRAYRLEDGQTGALVTSVSAGGTADGVLKVGDVLLAVDGVPVAEDLTVAAEEGFRVNFQYLLQSRQVGSQVEMTILRDGRTQKKKATLYDRPLLVPGNYTLHGASYYIIGGLVFQPLTLDYLYFTSYSAEDCFSNDLDYYGYFHNSRVAGRDQVVLLSKVLPHSLNRGYHDMVDYIVATVQGRQPRDLADLVRTVEGSTEPLLKLVMETGEVVVLDLPQARRENENILRLHNVRSDRSGDLGKK